MNKFMKFWEKRRDLVLIGVGLLLLFSLVMIPIWANHEAEKDKPMEPTSMKGIRASSFEYKGHQYVLFEKSNILRSSNIVHDPDCKKCK